MKALITGGAGFIGSHLTDLLVARGDDVVVLDDLSTGTLDNLEAARLVARPGALTVVEGSVTDADLVDQLVDGVDVVFHLAAAVGVFTIQQDTLTSLHTNVHGTEVVLDAAWRHGARFVLASTSEVYGKNTTTGLREDDDRILGSPLLSRWSYAEAKALDETLTYQYALHRGLRAVIVRPFNTTGPRQSGRYGMVVPRLVHQALSGSPLTVFGSGEQTRCFAHVADVTRIIAALADHPAAQGQVFNVGNPEEVSINELAARVLARTGSASQVSRLSYADAYGPGFEDMERRVPCCDRVLDLLGTRMTRGLDDIIDDVVEHFAPGGPTSSASAAHVPSRA